jgi:hypothetical protein
MAQRWRSLQKKTRITMKYQSHRRNFFDKTIISVQENYPLTSTLYYSYFLTVSLDYRFPTIGTVNLIFNLPEFTIMKAIIMLDEQEVGPKRANSSKFYENVSSS